MEKTSIEFVSLGWPVSDLMKRQIWDITPYDFPKGPWCGDSDLYMHSERKSPRTLSGELFGSPEDSQGTPNNFFW